VGDEADDLSALGGGEVGKVGGEQALGERTDDGESGHLAHEQVES
jgi:hypothetical protein